MAQRHAERPGDRIVDLCSASERSRTDKAVDPADDQDAAVGQQRRRVPNPRLLETTCWRKRPGKRIVKLGARQGAGVAAVAQEVLAAND